MGITNEIKAIAQYLGQRIVICEPGTKPVSDYLEGVDLRSNIVMATVIAERVSYPLSWIKLILRPLSAITDEDAIELGYIIDPKVGPLEQGDLLKEISSVVDALSNSEYKDAEGAPIRLLWAYQFLQARGYDLPLSLLGGQTLKEAGLAIYGPEIEPHNINFGEEGRP